MKIPKNFRQHYAELDLAIEAGSELYSIMQEEVLIIEIKYGRLKLDTEYKVIPASSYPFEGGRVIKQRINQRSINNLTN